MTAKKKPAAIYGLVDPVSGEIRYVGKANNPAARRKGHMRDAASQRRDYPVHHWIRKLLSSGKEPALVILDAAPADWREAERRLIAEHGKSGHLLNVAPGGDEPYCPPEVRSANGRRMNAARQADPIADGNRRVLQKLGMEAYYFRRIGKPEKAARMVAALERVKALAAAQPEWVFFQFAASPVLRKHLGVPEAWLPA